MKKILITGINGFLGSHIAKKLSKEFEIIGIEYSVENLWRLEGASFEVYTSEDASLKKIFEKHQIFAIIHAATVYRSIKESISDILKTNILLPVKLYELANKYQVSTFLNTDSFFNDKKYQYSYLSEYTQSKNNALEWLKLLNVSGTCKLVNMKIFHMYGPGDALTKFIPSILLKIKENTPSLDLTEGKQTRDFIYIDDVVQAFEVVLHKYNEIPSFQEFEVGTGNEVSLLEMVTLMKELTESSTILNFGALPYRTGEIMKSKADNKELLNLGFNIGNSIQIGLLKVLNN
jgi:nucleoside-diphosphate-sugar epimerase